MGDEKHSSGYYVLDYKKYFELVKDPEDDQGDAKSHGDDDDDGGDVSAPLTPRATSVVVTKLDYSEDASPAKPHRMLPFDPDSTTLKNTIGRKDAARLNNQLAMHELFKASRVASTDAPPKLYRAASVPPTSVTSKGARPSLKKISFSDDVPDSETQPAAPLLPRSSLKKGSDLRYMSLEQTRRRSSSNLSDRFSPRISRQASSPVLTTVRKPSTPHSSSYFPQVLKGVPEDDMSGDLTSEAKFATGRDETGYPTDEKVASDDDAGSMIEIDETRYETDEGEFSDDDKDSVIEKDETGYVTAEEAPSDDDKDSVIENGETLDITADEAFLDDGGNGADKESDHVNEGPQSASSPASSALSSAIIGRSSSGSDSMASHEVITAGGAKEPSPLDLVAARMTRLIDSIEARSGVSALRAQLGTIREISEKFAEHRSYPKELYILCTRLTTDLDACERSLGSMYNPGFNLDDQLESLRRIPAPPSARIENPTTGAAGKSALEKALESVIDHECKHFWNLHFTDVVVSTEKVIDTLLKTHPMNFGNGPDEMKAELGTPEIAMVKNTLRMLLDENGDGSVSPLVFETFLELFGPLSKCVFRVAASLINFWPFTPRDSEPPKMNLYPWFRWDLDRISTIQAFRNASVGTFIIRRSSRRGYFAVSIRLHHKTSHCLIRRDLEGYKFVVKNNAKDDKEDDGHDKEERDDSRPENTSPTKYESLSQIVNDMPILAHPYTDPFQRIHFNVSGQLFTCYAGTFSERPKSVLGKLVQGDFTNREEIYFNRDPVIFRKILNFYRNHKVYISENDDIHLHTQEFEYFGIPIIAENSQPSTLGTDSNSKFFNKFVKKDHGSEKKQLVQAESRENEKVVPVALKTLPSDMDYEQELMSHSRAGNQIAAPIFDQSEDDRCIAYATGQTFRAAMQEGHFKGSYRQKLFVAQIMDLLVRLQNQGLVHCNVTPDTLVNHGNGWRLTDFGNLTSEGEIRSRKISPRYTAPEVVAHVETGTAFDIKASYAQDVWSFGVILHEAILGKKLFETNGEATVKLTEINFDRSEIFPLVPSEKDLPHIKLLAGMLKTDPTTRLTPDIFCADERPEMRLFEEIRKEQEEFNEKLESFHSDVKDVIVSLEDVKDKLTSMGLSILNALDKGPRLFILLPESDFEEKGSNPKRWKRFRGKAKNIFKTEWRVLLLCEGKDDGVCHIHKDHQGYTRSINKAWLQKCLPLLKVTLQMVSIVVQMGSYGAINLGPLTQLLPSNVGVAGLSERLDDVSEDLNYAAASVDGATHTTKEQTVKKILGDKVMLQNSQEALAELLKKEQDPTGGLKRCLNKHNQYVWVCEDCQEGLPTHSEKEHEVDEKYMQSIVDSLKGQEERKENASNEEHAGARSREDDVSAKSSAEESQSTKKRQRFLGRLRKN